MPSATPDGHGVPAVASCAAYLDNVLARADTIKDKPSIEPPLTKSKLGDVAAQLSAVFDEALGGPSDDGADQRRLRQFAMFETAARDLFSHLIASTPIESPEFVRVWNFLDLLAILSDEERCDPALLFWLVEELLDSQTISGCRKIFDFLESRRERITAKHFKQKQLVILRSCNELLRRLSRAEDTAFCGRVFIFLFQSFPLGDKSSVNLRGEYHIENVTVFDEAPPLEKEGEEAAAESMDVDDGTAAGKEAGEQKQASLKAVTFDPKKAPSGKPPLNADVFYPVFWSLQDSFSQPKKLFDETYFARFRGAMETTMTAFRSIQVENGSRPAKTASSDDSAKTLKRKREDGETDLANAFNPKYLTSRDLFELEISDLSFRRHVLVQALIVMDFLLSLSAKAKEKLSTARAHNKAVEYLDQKLNEDDTKWATDMKRSIADYLRQGFEGPYFFRMVETVLSRDKNWVRWKIENCPPMGLPPVSADLFSQAKQMVQRTATNKRLRPIPMGSLNLDFLSSAENRPATNGDHRGGVEKGDEGTAAVDDEDEDPAMERLKNSDRYALPELASFQRKIEDDDFEIEMPTNAQTKAAAIEGKASKSWRALRIAGRSKLAAFDRIDDPDKIGIVFEEGTGADEEDEDGAGDDEVTAGSDDMPEDKSLVVVISAATTDADRSKPIVEGLMGKIPGVFKRVVRHAAREAREGESGGRDYTFVTAEAFSVMVGNDQFIEFGEVDGVGYGTSRKAVEAASEKGKVPVLEVPLGSATQIQENAFPHRSILLSALPPDTDTPEGGFSLALDAGVDTTATADKIHDFIYGRVEEDVEVGDAPGGNDDQPQVQQEPLEMAEDTPAAADDAMAVDDEQGQEGNGEEKKEDEEEMAEPEPQPEPEPELGTEETKAGHAQDEEDGDSFEGVEMPEEDDEMEE